MPRYVSTIPPCGRLTFTLDHELATAVERVHRPGEAMALTLNRILRAGVGVIRGTDGHIET